mgnify:CR=1 FL=1
MKRPYAVLLAAALSLSASHALADGVFKAALYDDAGRVVLARAGGVASDAGGPAVRLGGKAGAGNPDGGVPSPQRGPVKPFAGLSGPAPFPAATTTHTPAFTSRFSSTHSGLCPHANQRGSKP